jgi:hypothetical protein
MSDYIADAINKHIAAITDKPVAVYWTGDVPVLGEPTRYGILVDGDDTDFYVLDDRAFLTLYEDRDRNTRDEIDTVRSYNRLAELIVDVVPVPEEDA